MKNRYVKYKGYKIDFVEYFYVVDQKKFDKLPDAIKYIDKITKDKFRGSKD